MYTQKHNCHTNAGRLLQDCYFMPVTSQWAINAPMSTLPMF